MQSTISENMPVESPKPVFSVPLLVWGDCICLMVARAELRGEM